MCETEKELVDFLKKRGGYEEKTDNVLVHEYFYNLNLILLAKEDIELRGIVANVAGEGKAEVLQKNHSVSIYNEALSNIMKISGKLGLSVKDRIALDIEPERLGDGGGFLD